MPTRLTCRAQHPEGRRGKVERFGDRIHGTFIQEVPFDAKPTGRILMDFAEVRSAEGDAGRLFMGARCGGCKLITEYQITDPQQRKMKL